MFFDRKIKVAEESAMLEPVGPKPRKVRVSGDTEEVASYIKLCQKSGSETPAVKMLRFLHFLADRGIPEYNLKEVYEYLTSLAKRKRKTGYDSTRINWFPLREVDKGTAFQGSRFFSTQIINYLYPQLVPGSVIETVGTIVEEFPDAKFLVSAVETVPDPFLAVTFPGQPLVVVDFWNEPGFRPTK